MPKYFDLHEHKEDCRIRQIGCAATNNPGKRVGLVVDDEKGKPERYIAKIQEWFPTVKVVRKVKGPTPGAVTIILIVE